MATTGPEYVVPSPYLLYEHEVGDDVCTVGWCGNGFPITCECGGLIHADFGDENMDCEYWLYTLCDRCGAR